MLQLERERMTVEEFARLPETTQPCQLIDGEVHMAPAPSPYHQIISVNLEYLLMDFLAEHPIGRMLHAPFDVYLPGVNVFQPDICVFSKEQGDYLDKRGAIQAPWLVVEILSPRSRRLDAGRKREVYAEAGTRELWLIDPDKREVAVYALREDAERPVQMLTEKDRLTSALLPGLDISLSKVFAR